jgi:hypothetical protein
MSADDLAPRSVGDAVLAAAEAEHLDSHLANYNAQALRDFDPRTAAHPVADRQAN